eukprot:1380335-Amorphochlora_amoeboformis.AAC.1
MNIYPAPASSWPGFEKKNFTAVSMFRFRVMFRCEVKVKSKSTAPCLSLAKMGVSYSICGSS